MFLPKPPTLEALRAHTPTIAPVPGGVHRPFWSVMIPTYNSGEYLRQTLQSVLSQDLGEDQMQIEVVDGCSTEDDPEKITKELGKGRVAFHRLAENQGPAHTFNACVERARGNWVHLLHGDDMVLPGFYEAYAAAIDAHPEARTVMAQTVIVDEENRWIDLFGLTPPAAGGIVDDFLTKQAVQQLVLCPSVVVHREAYERAGGFCTSFTHVTDWDMWFRLGEVGSVAWMKRPYALFRVHRESDTSRQNLTASNIRERYFVIAANLQRLNHDLSAADVKPSWRARLAFSADKIAWELDQRNAFEGRYNQARWAWMLQPTPRRLLMLAKSWLKHRLSRNKASGVRAVDRALMDSQ
jgi:glycosyltransferase involved in cell wall biosynthesis